MNLNLYIGKKIGGKSGIATISVALSITVILISIAVSDGFKREIGEKAVAFSGEIMLTVPGQEITTYKYSINENLSFLPKIAAFDEVKSVSGVAYTVGMIKTDDAISGALYKGVEPDYDLKFFSEFLIDGKLPVYDGTGPSNEILISKRMSETMGFTTGDKVTSYFIGEENVRARKFTISGIYDIQLEDVDERLIICDRRQAQQLNGWETTEVSCIEIGLGGNGTGFSSAQRRRVLSEIDDILMNSDCDEDSSVTLQSVEDVYGTLFDWLDLLNMNVLIILILMTAVAGFNMVSGLLIILFRNTSAIGMFKSIGMRTSQVCKVFLWKAGLIVVRGMLIGDVMAASLMLLQKQFRIMELDPANYFVDHVPVQMDIFTFIVINLISFIIMMLIMMIPCRFVSGISPDRTIKAA